MAVDLQNLTSGPAELKIGGTRLSHTQGGIKVKVSPKQRMRTVDQYGDTPIDVIHTGDDVRVTAPLAEWTADVLGAIYQPGNDQSAAGSGAKYLGIGRSAGFIYVASDLKVIPLLAADAAKLCQFWRAVPIGSFELSHDNKDDRVFNVEWVCLADPESGGGADAIDGQIVGKIFLTGS